MTFENGQVTLSFVLPLKSPARNGKTLSLEIYDPTFFVSFSLAEGETLCALAGAPQGLRRDASPGRSRSRPTQQKLSRELFRGADRRPRTIGSNFANRAIVACP